MHSSIQLHLAAPILPQACHDTVPLPAKHASLLCMAACDQQVGCWQAPTPGTCYVGMIILNLWLLILLHQKQAVVGLWCCGHLLICQDVMAGDGHECCMPKPNVQHHNVVSQIQ